jgi:peroxiredoxin
MSGDYHVLPVDLPEPEDDGGADHLTGLLVPPTRFETAAHGPLDLAALAASTLVVFVYPMTGTPGRPLPEGWDTIPGARGCTPQSCAFRDLHDEIRLHGAAVLGLSAQPIEEQRAFTLRERIPYPLVNDSALVLAAELDLPTFEVATVRLYKRLTFIARAGRVEKVFYPVFPPDRNAGDVLDWLERRSIRG